MLTSKINQAMRLDIALQPREFTGVYSGPFVSFADASEERMVFLASVGEMEPGEEMTFSLLQATSPLGAGAKAVSIAEGALANSAADVLALVDAAAVSIQADTIADGDTVTVNGVTFTAVDAVPPGGLGPLQFLCGVGDLEDSLDLQRVIDANLPGVYTVHDGADLVAVFPRDQQGGTVTVAVSDPATTIPLTIAASVILEVKQSSLDVANGYRYVALQAESGDTLDVAGICLRPRKTQPGPSTSGTTVEV